MTASNISLSARVGPSQPTVFIRFRPAWAYIEGIREFGRFFCQTTFNKAEIADRAQVMIQETLENAVKYSARSSATELDLLMSMDGEQLEISVCSSPAPEHLGTLRQELANLYSQDAEQAYLAAFERAARDPEASARLGLARLRYECGAELSVTEEGQGRIRVTARATL